jgi:hypothetical protein
MPSSNATQCNHIKTSGVRCGSPALRNRRYCYYHQRTRPVLINVGHDDNPKLFSLPLLEDAHDIQSALRQVALHYLNGDFSREKAGLMFYALQIATCNLKQMQAEKPQPDQAVDHVPQLTEIPRQEPVSQPVPLNSHTARLTRYPETPSRRDQYEDDIKRQAREIREQFAAQINDSRTNVPKTNVPSDDNKQTSESRTTRAESRYLN